jgi:hypothetical protein
VRVCVCVRKLMMLRDLLLYQLKVMWELSYNHAGGKLF